MKATILILSIFYILGLKIGHKIDLVKKSIPVKKIITYKIETCRPDKCANFNDEIVAKNDSDSLKGGTSYSDALLKTVKFINKLDFLL